MTRDQMKYLDIAKVKKLADSNNVEVFWFDDCGRLSISKVIGKKALVLAVEKLVAEISPEFPGMLGHAKHLAAELRAHLWPKSI